MYKRFSNLVNDPKGLGKKFETIELLKKIIRLLLESWNMNITTIEESKDLNKIGMDELIESQLTFEVKIKSKQKEIKPKKNIDLKVENEEGNSSTDEEDMSLLTKNFNKFLSKSKEKNSMKQGMNHML